MKLPLVAIVGRPNVGKSTLFNKLTGSRKAIVEETAGVTRDRVYGMVEWGGRRFDAVDTGGLELDAAKTGGTAKNREVATAMLDHAMKAVDEADAVIAVFDATEGLTPIDRDVLNRLRGAKKPVFFAVNKVDSGSREELQYEFYEAGVEKLWPISAEHGRGVNDLLDELVGMLPENEEGATRDESRSLIPEDQRIKVAVIGRPNVGKSSLVNRLLGWERSIVSAMAGTTRDAIDTSLSFQERDYLLIDTAGIRRKARVTERLEKFSVVKALSAVERADVAVLVIDALDGVHEQDAKIGGEIEERGRGAVIVLNKWDVARAAGATAEETAYKVRSTLKFMSWAPILFTSALTGAGVERILPTAAAAWEQWKRRIPTPKLNQWLDESVELHPPPASGRGPVKLSFVTTGGSRPPIIVIFTNHPEAIHFSYRRYLENTLRDRFGLEGTPVRIVFKKKKGKAKR